jgi:hypothetical protein
MGPEMKFSGTDLDVQYDANSGGGSNDPVGASLKTTPYDLPLVFRLGLAYDVEIGSKSIATFSSELKHPADNVQQGAFGVEFNYSDQFFLRSGYRMNTDEEGLAFGGGMNLPISKDTHLMVDYAWQDFGRLESTQRFSVGFAF